MKTTQFIDRHISSVPILQCSAASRRRCMPILFLFLLVISLVPLTGCSFDANVLDGCSLNLVMTGCSDNSSDLKLTKDYANHNENLGSGVLEAVVIKTVMTCKNQGMKFVKWIRRCKYNRTSFTEQSYKCLAVFIALIL